MVQIGATYAEALAASRERQAETGALEVHAYDHPDVLAGQGTVGREFEHDAPELTHVLVATGGGGLIGGIAAWYAGSAQVISVEPEGCPALHDALRAGRPVEAPVGGLAADSLGARQVGGLMFPIAQALCRRRRAGAGLSHRGGAAADLGPAAAGRRTGRRDRAGSAAVRCVHAARRRSRRRAGLWRQYRSREGGRNMSGDGFLVAVDSRGVATLTLNRPEIANAYDEDLLRRDDRGAGENCDR